MHHRAPSRVGGRSIDLRTGRDHPLRTVLEHVKEGALGCLGAQNRGAKLAVGAPGRPLRGTLRRRSPSASRRICQRQTEQFTAQTPRPQGRREDRLQAGVGSRSSKQPANDREGVSGADNRRLPSDRNRGWVHACTALSHGAGGCDDHGAGGEDRPEDGPTHRGEAKDD